MYHYPESAAFFRAEPSTSRRQITIPMWEHFCDILHTYPFNSASLRTRESPCKLDSQSKVVQGMEVPEGQWQCARLLTGTLSAYSTRICSPLLLFFHRVYVALADPALKLRESPASASPKLGGAALVCPITPHKVVLCF